MNGGVNGAVNRRASAGAARGAGGQARGAVGYTSAMDETLVRLREEGAVWRVVGEAVGKSEGSVQRRWVRLQKMKQGQSVDRPAADAGEAAGTGVLGAAGNGTAAGLGSAGGDGGAGRAAAGGGAGGGRAAEGDMAAWLSPSDVSDGGADETGGSSVGLAGGGARAVGNPSPPLPPPVSWRVPAGPRWGALPSLAYCGGGSLLRTGGPLEPGAEIPEGGADRRPGLWDASCGVGTAQPAGRRGARAAGVAVAAAGAVHAWHDTPSGVWERVVLRWREFRRQADAAHPRPAGGGDDTGERGAQRGGGGSATTAGLQRGAECASAGHGGPTAGSPNRPGAPNRPGDPNRPSDLNRPVLPNRPGAPSSADPPCPVSVWDVLDEACFGSGLEGDAGLSQGGVNAWGDDTCLVASLADDEAYEMPRERAAGRRSGEAARQLGRAGCQLDLGRGESGRATDELVLGGGGLGEEGGELVAQSSELDPGHRSATTGGGLLVVAPLPASAHAPRIPAAAPGPNVALLQTFEAHASSAPAGLWGGAYSVPAAHRGKGAVWLALQSLADLVPPAAAPTPPPRTPNARGSADLPPASGLYRVTPPPGIRAGQLFLAEVAGVRLALVAPAGWRGGGMGLRLPHLGSSAAGGAGQPGTQPGTEPGAQSGTEPGTGSGTTRPILPGRTTPANIPTVTATPIAPGDATPPVVGSTPVLARPGRQAAGAAVWSFELASPLERGSVVMADLSTGPASPDRVAVLLPRSAGARQQLVFRRELTIPTMPPAAALPPPLRAGYAVCAGQTRLAVSVHGAAEQPRALMVQLPAEAHPVASAWADPPLATLVLPAGARGGTYLCAPTWRMPAGAGAAAGAGAGGAMGVGGGGGSGAAGKEDGAAAPQEGAGPVGAGGGGVVSAAGGSDATATGGEGFGATVGGGEGGGSAGSSGGGGGLAWHPLAPEHFEAVVPPETPPGASVLATAPGGRMVWFRLPSRLPAHRRVMVQLQPTQGAVWRGEVGEACVGMPAASLA